MDTESGIYRDPEDWSKSTPSERIQKLRSETGGAFSDLVNKIGENTVLMHLDELDSIVPDEVRRLAELRGSPDIVRFLNHLNNRKNLTSDSYKISAAPGAILKRQEIKTLCDNVPPLIDPIIIP